MQGLYMYTYFQPKIQGHFKDLPCDTKTLQSAIMYGALVAQHTCAQDEKTTSVYTFHKDGEMFGSCLHDDTCTCKFTLTTLTLGAFKSVDF